MQPSPLEIALMIALVNKASMNHTLSHITETALVNKALINKASMKHSDLTLSHITAILGTLLLTKAAKASVVNK